VVLLIASGAGATTARFEGDLNVRFAGKSADGTQILLEATVLAVADGTGGNVFGLARRIPVLGDVPLLGALFKSRTDRKAKFGSATDLFVIVTPTILTDDEPLLGPGTRAPARAAPITPPRLAPTTTTLTGVFKVDRTFQHAKLKAKLKYEATAQDGPIAGQTVKGKVKLQFSGDRL
jgi:Flp pilus assembly secretin CpaC